MEVHLNNIIFKFLLACLFAFTPINSIADELSEFDLAKGRVSIAEIQCAKKGNDEVACMNYGNAIWEKEINKMTKKIMANCDVAPDQTQCEKNAFEITKKYAEVTQHLGMLKLELNGGLNNGSGTVIIRIMHENYAQVLSDMMF